MHSLPRRFSMLIIGWALIALAVSGIIRANLGAGPLDVLNTGIANQLHIQVGTAGWVSAACILLLACLLGARPGAATFAGAFLIGMGVNVVLPLMPQPGSLAVRATMLLAGVLLLCVGCALAVISDLGSGVVDLLMFALHKRGPHLVLARIGIEVSGTALGVLMGGSAGFATLLIALCIGPALQRTLRLMTALLEPPRASSIPSGTLAV